QTLPKFVDEQHRLLGQNSRPNRQCGHRGVYLSETVNAASRTAPVRAGKQLHACCVTIMAAPKCRVQDRRVEELLHPIRSRNRFSRSLSIRSTIDSLLRSPWYTQMPYSFLSICLGRTGRSVIMSLSLSKSSESPGLNFI